MGILFFDDTVRKIIKNLISFADKNKIPIRVLKKMIKGKLPPIGDNPDYNLIIGTYRIVFSIEEHRLGWCRHISISVLKPENKNLLPNETAVLEIMKEFSFKHKKLEKIPFNLNYWIEDISENEKAFNVIEKI